MSTFVIAEVGVNHNGDLELARQLIKASAATGADAIKFQTAIPELVQTPSAPKARYQEENGTEGDTALEMSRGFHFSLEVFAELQRLVEAEGKMFLSTAFDLKSVDYLASLGQSLFKIPSGEITNLPYLRAVAKVSTDVILSTGMATLDEIGQALDVLMECGIQKERITVLQCNTAYPTPLNDANVSAMRTIADKFNVAVGYSDHTIGPSASLAAVALGATVIEKHITLDCSLPGPDHSASMEPQDFSDMVSSIREIELVLGTGVKAPSPSEKENSHIARRGVYFSRDLPAGHVITSGDLVCLRPENGTSPMSIDSIVGNPLAVDVKEYDSIIGNTFG